MMQYTRTQAALEMSLLRRISLRMRLLTALGPITLSARNDVRKTKKMSEQNPSAEATHVFVPLDNLLPLKRLINLNWGLAVDLRRQRVPKNSKT